MKKKKTKHVSNIDESFIADESKHISQEDLKKLERKRSRLSKMMKLKVFAKQKDKFKLLLEIINQYRNGVYNEIPWRSIAAITFTLIYIVNPLDIVPDVLPIVGYVDDVSVFMALLKLVEQDISDYKDWKAVENDLKNE